MIVCVALSRVSGTAVSWVWFTGYFITQLLTDPVAVQLQTMAHLLPCIISSGHLVILHQQSVSVHRNAVGWMFVVGGLFLPSFFHLPRCSVTVMLRMGQHQINTHS